MTQPIHPCRGSSRGVRRPQKHLIKLFSLNLHAGSWHLYARPFHSLSPFLLITIPGDGLPAFPFDSTHTT